MAGRIAARRGHGKAAFIDLVDRSGRIQLHAREDVLGAESFERLIGLDLGDIIGAEGRRLRHQAGRALAAARRLDAPGQEPAAAARQVPRARGHRDPPAPARARPARQSRGAGAVPHPRRGGLGDPRSGSTSAASSRWRRPVLQPLYGGALARPFVTHHNALDRDLYLRIATELYLKRCIVGGIERVYELGKDFRNEGISFKHNPEFTMLEWYEAYADYTRRGRAGRAARRARGRAGPRDDDDRARRGGDRARAAVAAGDARATRSRSGPASTSRERPSREELAGAMGARRSLREGWGKLVDGGALEARRARADPAHLRARLSGRALTVRKAPPHRGGLVERFEPFIAGVEIGNAFTELNDPDEQRRRFEQQLSELRRGDEEAQPFDEAFVEALEHGMPPTAGVGLGIDRLVMVLTGAANLREVVLFPAMRT